MEIKCQLTGSFKVFGSCQGDYLLKRKNESVWNGVESGGIVGAGVRRTSAGSSRADGREWRWKEVAIWLGGGEWEEECWWKAALEEGFGVVSLLLLPLLFQNGCSDSCRTGSAWAWPQLGQLLRVGPPLAGWIHARYVLKRPLQLDMSWFQLY